MYHLRSLIALCAVFCGANAGASRAGPDVYEDAAYSIAGHIRSIRTRVCERSSRMLECRFAYEPAFELLEAIVLKAKQLPDADAEAAVSIQQGIDADFASIDRILERAAHEYAP